jgi:hypothetical protein
MSQNWIWINSASYRRFVGASRDNRWLLLGATVMLGGAGAIMAAVTAQMTNPNYAEEGYKSKQAELAQLPLQSQVRTACAACQPHPPPSCAGQMGALTGMPMQTILRSC